jgi:SSS family solute:Na+ symporter
MNITLFILILFSLQIFYFFIGRRASKNVVGKSDYFLANKSVGLFPLMMTFLATQIGGGVILGAADEAARFGWPVLLYPLGAVLGLILLGSGIGRRLAGFHVSTVAEIFEVVYGSRVLRTIVSLLSIISLFMILIAQVVASRKFLIGLGFDHTPLFLLFWSIVIIYTSRGGLRAVISTDMVQAIFFSAVFLLCLGFVLMVPPTTTLIQMPHLADFSAVSSKLCGWLFMPLLFMVIEQDMAQRCFAAASSKIVSRASLLAGLSAMIICIVPVFFGVLAAASGFEVAEGGSVFMTAIAKTTNSWITALVGCAVLAAIISTATSLINAISANISHDFTSSINRRIDGATKTSMRMIQGITALISISAIVSAFYFNNIVDLLIQSYELSVSCLAVPLIMALYNRQGELLSASLALSFGALSFLFFQIYPISFPREVLSIGLSMLGYGIGESFRKWYLLDKGSRSVKSPPS